MGLRVIRLMQKTTPVIWQRALELEKVSALLRTCAAFVHHQA